MPLWSAAAIDAARWSAVSLSKQNQENIGRNGGHESFIRDNREELAIRTESSYLLRIDGVELIELTFNGCRARRYPLFHINVLLRWFLKVHRGRHCEYGWREIDQLATQEIEPLLEFIQRASIRRALRRFDDADADIRHDTRCADRS